jgi:hypothetical protein
MAQKQTPVEQPANTLQGGKRPVEGHEKNAETQKQVAVMQRRQDMNFIVLIVVSAKYV